MATKASTQAPAGSMEWVAHERKQMHQFHEQENEDFAFAARNEFEWLNEHMAEIFSHNHLNITEIFKTPGKLRGKTPRTARRRDAQEARAVGFSTQFDAFANVVQPLTDVFASSIKYNGSPSRPITAGKKLRIQSPAISKHVSKITKTQKPPSPAPGLQEPGHDTKPLEDPQQRTRDAVSVEQRSELSDGRRTTGGSFHSARENVAKETPAPEVIASAVPGSFPRDTPMLDEQPTSSKEAAIAASDVSENPVRSIGQSREARRSASSEASTPEKRLVRASLNFPTLPAREPLTTKKSIGHHGSSMESKNQQFNRSSYLGRLTGGKSLGNVPQPMDQDEMDVDAITASEESTLEAKKEQHKTYTQRLQDRINQLGKAPAPRPNKSAAPNPTSSFAAATYPPHEIERTRLSPIPGSQSVPDAVPGEAWNQVTDIEDDWTLPPLKSEQTRPQLAKSRSVDVMEQFADKESVGGDQLGFKDGERDAARMKSPARPDLLQGSAQIQHTLNKSASTTHLPHVSQDAPANFAQQKTISVSNPLAIPFESTTPAGSPSRLDTDGHLRDSKTKLQSIMRSARGLFTSSAGISAQAKLEALSPSASRVRLGGIDEVLRAEFDESQKLYPTLPSVFDIGQKPANTALSTVTSSSMHQKDDNRDTKTANDIKEKGELHKDAMETEVLDSNPPLEQSLENTSKPIRHSPRRAVNEPKEDVREDAQAKSTQPIDSTARPASQQSKTKEIRRPVKPLAKPTTKPPQVAIRVGTMRIPLTNNALSSTLQDTLPPNGKQSNLAKKGSTASLSTAASTQSFKASTAGASKTLKPNSAAAQKREQAEKEAQRKEEEKRERERKRAVAMEEARRKEREREEAESQKERDRVAAEAAKQRAQKEAAEKKRAEALRKNAQQPSHLKQERAGNDLAKSVRGDNAHQRPPSRQDAVARPPSRMDDMSKAPSNGNRALNPANKPIKRVFDPDRDDELSRPVPQVHSNYQQANDKRRKTGDEEEVRQPNRPTLQPPIRQSNMRKPQPSISHEQGFGYSTHAGAKSSLFNGKYPIAPPPAQKSNAMGQGYAQSQGQPSHGPSAQPIRVGHPLDTAKYQSGKIPFAEASNPPAQQIAFKTPHAVQKSAVNTNKSSPMYTNGEHIHLDDIATDSESEDSEDERERKQAMPDWVRTPNLFEHLAGQEQLNPDAVFGPIAPLNMEEMFKDKSRHHRFRNRTSSANWFGTDRLTEDDIRQDQAAREKLRKDGGWTYGL